MEMNVFGSASRFCEVGWKLVWPDEKTDSKSDKPTIVGDEEDTQLQLVSVHTASLIRHVIIKKRGESVRDERGRGPAHAHLSRSYLSILFMTLPRQTYALPGC